MKILKEAVKQMGSDAFLVVAAAGAVVILAIVGLGETFASLLAEIFNRIL